MIIGQHLGQQCPNLTPNDLLHQSTSSTNFHSHTINLFFIRNWTPDNSTITHTHTHTLNLFPFQLPCCGPLTATRRPASRHALQGHFDFPCIHRPPRCSTPPRRYNQHHFLLSFLPLALAPCFLCSVSTHL